jgi:cytosine permease
MASNLPDYVASAQRVPQANRIPWFKSTAQTYAGIMLWFVFWHDVPVGQGIPGHGAFSATAGGMLAQGLGVAFLGLVLAALLCHFCYYVVPGMMGMKTGLPLYIVGTSTYGVLGGFLMPGFLMGLLQFGWLSVNAFFAGILLCAPLGYGAGTVQHAVVASVWAILAAFMGLKGIHYVARVATFLPLIPLVILVVLFAMTYQGLGNFNPQTVVEMGARDIPLEKGEFIPAPAPALPAWKIVAVILTYIIGFFATAGAAGADFGMNNRDGKDVQLGGLVGISLATIFAGGLSLLIVAGAYGMGAVGVDKPLMETTQLMGSIVDPKVASGFMWALALAAFPPACFSSFIAANSFKTTLPKVNPFISVGIGTAVAIVLAVRIPGVPFSGVAGNVIGVFVIIGASFGPICGAMAADYLLAGMKWPGPRAAFNPAGWISWIVGFTVGIAEVLATAVPQLASLKGVVPVPPLSAFVVGFLLYYILAKLGLQSRVLEMPQLAAQPAAE